MFKISKPLDQLGIEATLWAVTLPLTPACTVVETKPGSDEIEFASPPVAVCHAAKFGIIT